MHSEHATERLSQLEAAAAKKADELRTIREELASVRAAQLAEYVLRLREEIIALRFDPEAVRHALAGPSRTTPPRRRLRLKDDHSCVYAGQGQLPSCLLVRMRAHGLDPKISTDRKQFIADYMEPC
ncbi:MAG: hypothetical protein EOM91_19820 [Sphingobacteriia bacterium]|jgi:hypothetical protein|nr:hypothetical protein [Sphingobacteriia bacterium]